MSPPAEVPAEFIRRRVYFSGRVQGVGFRFTASRIAERFSVVGWVRNLPDGRVEMVAEGAEAELARFIAAVQGAMKASIQDVQSESEPATGEFQGFTIAR